jgi:hypothetical protein
MEEAQRIQAAAETRLQEQQQREETLTQQIAKEMEEERHRMEAEFAAAAQRLILARQRQQDTQAVKQGAEAEAQRIIAEFKAAQEARQAKDHAHITAARGRLQQEAQTVQQLLDAAHQAKAEAEITLQDVGKKTAELRKKATAEGGGDSYQAEINRIQTQAIIASKRRKDAMAKEATAEARQRENVENFAHAREEELQITERFQADLEQWIMEQERVLSSSTYRQLMEKHHANAERIRARAERVKKGKQEHAQALLDELATKLGEKGD